MSSKHENPFYYFYLKVQAQNKLHSILYEEKRLGSAIIFLLGLNWTTAAFSSFWASFFYETCIHV